MTSYETIETGGAPVKAWVRGVPLEDQARQQLINVASLPFVHSHVAAMPDVHWSLGATVGSVIPCRKAIIPAAVGVDIGCGMMAVQTTLRSHHLPDSLKPLRTGIEAAVPHGRTSFDPAKDAGAWTEISDAIAEDWKTRPYRQSTLQAGLREIVEKHPKLGRANSVHHLGTLGTGNHFIEVCLDESDTVWVMLHSGSRGIGNKIGTYFIEKAKEEMLRWYIELPDPELAYLPESTPLFGDYVKALTWAQAFARANREIMMNRILAVLERSFTEFGLGEVAVNCHHNYVAQEKHFGAQVWVTRKGAVRAGEGELGIIPGSMGVRSYIVRGKGNPDSFCSCSHGAGRAMSRKEARRRFSVEQHAEATKGVECRKDEEVLDETPMAYKDIDAVIAAQKDLVDVVHTLKQTVCVKG